MSNGINLNRYSQAASTPSYIDSSQIAGRFAYDVELSLQKSAKEKAERTKKYSYAVGLGAKGFKSWTDEENLETEKALSRTFKMLDSKSNITKDIKMFKPSDDYSNKSFFKKLITPSHKRYELTDEAAKMFASRNESRYPDLLESKETIKSFKDKEMFGGPIQQLFKGKQDVKLLASLKDQGISEDNLKQLEGVRDFGLSDLVSLTQLGKQDDSAAQKAVAWTAASPAVMKGASKVAAKMGGEKAAATLAKWGLNLGKLATNPVFQTIKFLVTADKWAKDRREKKKIEDAKTIEDRLDELSTTHNYWYGYNPEALKRSRASKKWT
jgi:hypothetical protein